MKYNPLINSINKLRNQTPLSVRHKIGPVIAYVFYLCRIYLHIGRPSATFLSIPETLDYIHQNNSSVIRYGDGEITLMDGGDLLFQKYDPGLADKLRKIFAMNHRGLLICATDIWGKLDHFAPYAKTFNMHQAYRTAHIWRKLFQKSKTYGETNITRHYLGYNDKTKAAEIFKKLFSLWEEKAVVLVEGEKSRLGVGNNMFDNTTSLKRILCPAENAYFSYYKILNSVKKVGKDNLILLSLGPTAKVLAYDLYKLGYRVIDIGHIDMEYEMFLRNSNAQVKVRYKYFNEIHERDPEECTDEKYLNQILTKIE